LSAPILLFAQSKRTLDAHPSTIIDSFTHGFYTSLPANYNSSGKKYPLLVFLHGQGEVGDGSAGSLPAVLRNGPPMQINEQLNLNTNAYFPDPVSVNGQSFEFIVICPQLNTWPWNVYEQIAVNDVIDYAIANYRVDTAKMYLTGLSMGGGIAWEYPGFSGPMYAKRLAGLLVIAGASSPSSYRAAEIAKEHLPVWATANSVDNTVPTSYTTDYVDLLNQAGATPAPLMTIFPDVGHGGWVKTYGAPGQPGVTNSSGQNVYQWMLQYRRIGDTVIQDIGTPLPVTWGDYEAARAGTSVVVTWSTNLEQNNRYFIVQRSQDGQNFSDMDTVAAFDQPHTYSIDDVNAPDGQLFYRLEQVDLDNQYHYSGIMVVASAGNAGKGFRLSPNPASGTVYLELVNDDQGRLELSLSDAVGRMLRKWTFDKQGVKWVQSIDVGNLPAGSYFLQMKGVKTREVRAFIKK
jgi:hypothetical protein